MNKDSIINELEGKMTRTLGSLEHDLNGLRTGRASPSLLDPVMVEAYGDKMSISQVASVTVPEPRLISVQVWDSQLVKAVEKAIVNANLGVTPSADGQLIRIPIPSLTEERRIEMAKLCHKYGENAKVAVRNIRRDGMDIIKKFDKDGHTSEDEIREMGELLQKSTDKFILKIDEKVAAKEKDITQV